MEIIYNCPKIKGNLKTDIVSLFHESAIQKKPKSHQRSYSTKKFDVEEKGKSIASNQKILIYGTLVNIWGPVLENFLCCQKIFNFATEKNWKFRVNSLQYYKEELFLQLNYDICISETPTPIKEAIQQENLSGDKEITQKRPDKMEFKREEESLDSSFFEQMKHAMNGYFFIDTSIKVFNDILLEFFK